MSFSLAMLKAMKAEGLDFEACIRVLESDEPVVDSAADKRRAWDRERKREAKRLSGGNSGGNPPDAPPHDIDILPPKKDLPQEAKASLPQGAKAKRVAIAWPCPAKVDPAHWQDFLANRKRKRCPQTQTALDGVLADIAAIADDEWPPGKLVKHAAAKGWASINDPRKPMNGPQNGLQRQPSLRGTRPDPALDLYRAAVAEEQRENSEADRGTRPALPSYGPI